MRAAASGRTRKARETRLPRGAAPLGSSELHLRGSLGAGISGEIGSRLKSAHSCDERCRKPANGRVVLLGRLIEAHALSRNSVFGALKLGLKLLKAFIRFQLRIVFRDHEQARQRARELA